MVSRHARCSVGAFVVAMVAALAAGCVGTVEVAELPLQHDFEECNDFTMNDEVATVDCPKGELRILVSLPGRSPVHFVPLRFDPSAESLVVSADVRAPTPGLGWGVGCLASGLGKPGRGYALLLGAAGDAGILRMDFPGEGAPQEGRHAQVLEIIAEREDVPVLEPSRGHRLRLRCTEQPGGTVRLRASVDGGAPISVTDENGIAPFTAAFPFVMTDRPDTDVRFDNLAAGHTD